MKTNLNTTSSFIFLTIFVIALGGWVANIVKLLSELFDPITGLFIARIAGIFMAPLGSVLGFF